MPWKRSRRTRSSTAALGPVTMPPSPVVSAVVGGPDRVREQREVEGGGARGERRGVRAPDIARELALEALHARARREPARAHHRHRLVDLLVAQERTRERKPVVVHQSLRTL